MSSCVPTESLDYEWIHLIMQDRIPLEYFFHEFCGKLNSTKLGENVRTFHELCGKLHSSEFMENMFPSKFGEWTAPAKSNKKEYFSAFVENWIPDTFP